MDRRGEPLPEPCTQAPPSRRLLHALTAAAGWALFFYWWGIVLQRTGAAEIRFTLLFIAVATVLAVLLTVAWIRHNVALHQRKGPRTGVPEVSEDFRHDVLGRPLRFEGDPAAARAAQLVRICTGPADKHYRPSGQVLEIGRDEASAS